MNTNVTSKEEILKVSRDLIQEKGWSAVHIRSVAQACGVSVGSIYNYFPSKTELIGAAVESIWCEIFHQPEGESVFQSTQDCMVWIYQRMEHGCKEYPGFFNLHSFSFMQEEKENGKLRMQKTWEHILQGICIVLKNDAKVRPGAFSQEFTAEKFADVLFSLMLSAMIRQDYDPSAVLEMIRRTLY